MRAWRIAALLCLVAGAAQAQSPESLAWLRKIQEATRNLSYTGTFVYQHGGRSETSRITRLASADTERLEVLDGMPRELVRTRDTVRCYLPESKVVKLERRTPDRSFPALLPEKLSALAQHYDIALGETRRIGGFECKAVGLTPKDNLRYGYRLYADTASGMLVRAVTGDSAGAGVASLGALHIYTREVANHMVTVVGEAPAASVQRIANAVEYRRP